MTLTSWRALFARFAQGYALRNRRRRFLWRAFRSRHALHSLVNRTKLIRKTDILCFVCLRNEAGRLPQFLAHHRQLGVQHFLIVDNSSTDHSLSLLKGQPDVSLWQTGSSYRQARFGLDWITWLLMRYGHGHWCLTLDVDELLIYPHHQTRPLPALTGWLDHQGYEAMAAMMLDLYPAHPLSQSPAHPDVLQVLTHFDAGNYTLSRQEPMGHLWIQGGPRARMFFADDPRRAPTLNKLPLVRWQRRFAYVNSTHSALPARLNAVYKSDGGEQISGLLLHCKFLPEILDKSREEKLRQEHFNNAARYSDYYDGVIADPLLHCEGSQRLGSWRQLEALGLMSRGGWI